VKSHQVCLALSQKEELLGKENMCKYRHEAAFR